MKSNFFERKSKKIAVFFGCDEKNAYFCAEFLTINTQIMEIKKDPQVDLEPRKTTYVLTGLVAILAVLFIAFEWTNATYRTINRGAGDAVMEEEEEIVMTVQNTPPPPPPPPPMPDVIEQLTVVEDDVEVAEIEMQTAEDDANTIVEIVQAVEEGPVEEEDAEANTIFTVVEDEPEFPGGTKALMEFISKNLRYPAFAAENGIQGRVTLSFVVEKDGSVTDIQEMRSPSEDLTKEAKRVVQSMPKWKPGKQRGKPVRVKYMLPVTFRLQ